MDVEIGEVMMEVKAVASLSPEDMQRIVQAVLRAVDERESHRERVRAERRITGGVAEEREEEV